MAIKQLLNYTLIGIRPKTLPISICPIILATAWSYTQNHFHLLTTLATITAALFIQIGTNLANDYFDHIKGADTKKRVGPKRLNQIKAISREHIKKAFIAIDLCFIPFCIFIHSNDVSILGNISKGIKRSDTS